jgi:hypothetical protein
MAGENEGRKFGAEGQGQAEGPSANAATEDAGRRLSQAAEQGQARNLEYRTAGQDRDQGRRPSRLPEKIFEMELEAVAEIAAPLQEELPPLGRNPQGIVLRQRAGEDGAIELQRFLDFALVFKLASLIKRRLSL